MFRNGVLKIDLMKVESMCHSEVMLIDQIGEEVIDTGHRPAPLGSLLCRVLLPANRATIPEMDVLVVQGIHKPRGGPCSISVVEMVSRC